MNASHVRVGNEPIVHDAGSGGWTACGVMYDGFVSVALFFTDDPVDCMTCLVREALGPTNMLVYTFVIDPEPEK